MKVFILLLVLVNSFMFSFDVALSDDKSLMAYYNFDEGSGKIVNDLSGNGNKGTFKGNLKWVNGKFGKALDVEYPLVKDPDVVIVPDSKSLDITDTITIVAWTNLTRLPAGSECPTVLSKRSACGASNYQLFFRSGPSGKMCYWGGGGSDSYSDKCAITANSWHHVAITFDNKTLKFYLDGNNCDTQKRTTPLTPNDSPLYIGTDTCSNCSYTGHIIIDEVGIFNRILTDTDIKEVMDVGVGVFAQGWNPPVIPTSTDEGDIYFRTPCDVATDKAGNIYVVDIFNYRIQKIDPDGKLLTKWGTKGSGNGQFLYPLGIALDSAGNVYVTDVENNCVQKFDSNGKFIVKWGTKGTGNGQFISPFEIGVSPSGIVYVADTKNNRIQKFDLNGKFLAYCGTTGSGEGQIHDPIIIAFDPLGNLYT